MFKREDFTVGDRYLIRTRAKNEFRGELKGTGDYGVSIGDNPSLIFYSAMISAERVSNLERDFTLKIKAYLNGQGDIVCRKSASEICPQLRSYNFGINHRCNVYEVELSSDEYIRPCSKCKEDSNYE